MFFVTSGLTICYVQFVRLEARSRRKSLSYSAVSKRRKIQSPWWKAGARFYPMEVNSGFATDSTEPRLHLLKLPCVALGGSC